MPETYNRVELIKLLAKHEFISGEQLAKTLNVSRMTVNRQIAQLQQLGVDIFSLKGKGYKLNSTVELFDISKLNNVIGQSVSYFPEIESTNSFLLNHLGELTQHHVCIAEYQSSGRGRRGRNWFSPFGASLYYSHYFQFPGTLAAASCISLIVGLALYSTLVEQGINSLGVKWPNDLYLNGEKLAGILVEVNGQAEGPCHLVIGVGVNLHLPVTAKEKIDQAFTDLATSSLKLNKTELTIAFHEKLKTYLDEYQNSSMQQFISRWQEADLFINQHVKLVSGVNEITGIAKGINELGHLQLEIDGKLKSFAGGELSLRLLS
ncbi:bifunctional biotin--[acetyl-CoA-carboxylase] ligase/biotin operon repressor BirA [Paraferrimonas sp. SM1919]|uniref:bifunctional biotin--[acetyl-CoA-carboxylase] ligase/biotin operon repressor BirA n=1 Tax=Paraferrimonas sp. SM1919 TaxID=2662263 RepID=UPI0013D69CF4|nr:bifunctional biotin--[acetyl-CoA-carboxylase] ligase/biotin operon repressor BirA [Paraferrimonas sp. SM1919]